jgi:hypothetical protein
MEMRRGNPKKLGVKPPAVPLCTPRFTVHNVALVQVYTCYLCYSSGLLDVTSNIYALHIVT